MGESWVTNGTEFPTGLGAMEALREDIVDAIKRADEGVLTNRQVSHIADSVFTSVASHIGSSVRGEVGS